MFCYLFTTLFWSIFLSSFFDNAGNFNVAIINFAHFECYISTLPHYVIRYGRDCSVYSHFLQHHIVLSSNLLSQVLIRNCSLKCYNNAAHPIIGQDRHITTMLYTLLEAIIGILQHRWTPYHRPGSASYNTTAHPIIGQDRPHTTPLYTLL